MIRIAGAETHNKIIEMTEKSLETERIEIQETLGTTGKIDLLMMVQRTTYE
jgi:hypothetical protein